MAKDGSLYFDARGQSVSGLFKSVLNNGKYSEPDQIGDLFDSDYVDNCKSMDNMIIMSDRRSGRFHYELFVSFHKKDGTWSVPVYLGESFHGGKRASLGKITPEGKYLFFLRDFSFYWVNAELIEKLRPADL